MAKLQQYDQFVLVKVVPQTNGKADKIPVGLNGEAINAQDPMQWFAHSVAVDYARARGFSIGFVLTPNDPFFCIDIDSCLLPDRSGWSPVATEIVQMFKGAMVEISQSLTGLHVWGSAATMVPHKCRNVALGLELYHEKRFILLGVNQEGNEGIDCSAVLPVAIAKWFQPDAMTSATTTEWAGAPVEAWAGPENDDELLAVMLISHSAANIFGSSVSFAALWGADAEVLGAMWPSDGRPFDASSADAALAQRLAFWTGKNCERIQRMMLRSALMRDKYERPDYLRRTILGACARQTQVYCKPSPAQGEASRIAGGWVSQGDLPSHFSGCTYIEDVDRVMVGDGTLLGIQQFRSRYGGHKYVLDESKTTRNAWEAFREAEYWRPPYAHSTCFRPELTPGALIRHEGRVLANAWMPLTINAVEGDTLPFEALLRKLYPNGQDMAYLVAYLAAMVQYPGRKFQWAPLLQGCEGNGKTMIVQAVMRSIGVRYSHLVNAQDLSGNGGKFNGWIANKLFVCVEEIYTQDKREVLEILKPMITNTLIEIQSKGQNQYTGDNRANFIFTSNYTDAIQLNEEARRYGIFLSAQQSVHHLARDGMTPKYFADLWDWFEGRGKYKIESAGWKAVAYWLKQYPIPDEMNPATVLQRPPVTTSTATAISAGMGWVEQEVLESVEQGLPGFAGGWISSVMLGQMLERKRLTNRMPLNRYAAMMSSLGYVVHPHLVSGRTGSIVTPDGTRTRLYVKRGSPLLEFTDPIAIARRYAQDQVVPAIGVAHHA